MSPLTTTTAAHAFHLLNVLQNHNVQCAVEVNAAQPDPLMGISRNHVKVDFFIDCPPEEQTLIVELGEAEFAFNTPNHEFYYEISPFQIILCISNEDYAVWFNSIEVTSDAIDSAKEYNPDLNDQVLHMNIGTDAFEDAFQSLITLIREGRVIKSVKVLGDGNQVLTVGYVGMVSS
ncbi:hypothetical protein [Paenibacillus sp. FSL E2-0151]|uniref:hypothetical protein n=1 Tax=Paenibacillus sp. FSL E2-0151 TaxID=2921357 RepID=UPI0030EE14C9